MLLIMQNKRVLVSLQWRHNERDGVSNHQSLDCLINRFCRRKSKKTSRLRVTGLCEGNPQVNSEFPAQRASNAENVSIWWRHHVLWWGVSTICCISILSNDKILQHTYMLPQNSSARQELSYIESICKLWYVTCHDCMKQALMCASRYRYERP